MFEKISAACAVFRAGESVANPVAWKRGQITVAMLVTLGGAILALLHAFGVKFNLTTEEMASVFGGLLTVIGLFNHASTVASTDKIDVVGRTQPLQQVGTDGAQGAQAAGAAGADGFHDRGTATGLQGYPQTEIRQPASDLFAADRNSGA